MAEERRLLSLGRSEAARASRRADLQELAPIKRAIVSKIQELMKEGKAPEGIWIEGDGTDAASKTSTLLEVMRLFEDAGYKTDWGAFRAPNEVERSQHWLKRWAERVPVKQKRAEGEQPNYRLFFSDRSPHGDYAYGPNPESWGLEKKSRELAELYEDMAAKDVLPLRFLLYPGHNGEALPELWRPMYTFGKREARAAIARHLLQRGGVDDATKEALRQSQADRLFPGFGDLRSFHVGGDAHRRMVELAEATGGKYRPTIIDTEDRHAGRRAVFESVLASLNQL